MATKVSRAKDEQRDKPATDSPPESEDARLLLNEAVRRVLKPLASLKLTVALFAMAIFIVLAGTFAQVNQDIWEVIDEYFRVRFSADATPVGWFSEAFVRIPLQIFFPPSFFPSKPDVPGAFYFPKGWVIGFLMALNLLAAHLVRFKIQSAGPRLVGGIATIFLGCIVTWMVIESGSSEDRVLEGAAVDWPNLWLLMKLGLGALLATMVYGFIKLRAEQIWERILLGVSILGLTVLLGWILYRGDAAILSDPSMRILWQLIKGALAGVVLLVGCWFVFKKRAGIVLIHGGIGLMMLSELIVGTKHIETQMLIREGETVNYAQDIRSLELAVIEMKEDGEDRVVVVPGRYVRRQESISHAELPFDIEVLQFMQNSSLRRAGPMEPNPADTGLGVQQIAEERRSGTGTDMGGKVDLSSAYVLFKDEDGEPLGTYLLSIELGEQPVIVDGKPYFVDLRFERIYKPYSVTLLDVSKRDYIGTDTPRDYSSVIRLVDPTRNVDRDDIRIWMNNPLRFAGETFYQSDYQRLADGTEITGLQVVANYGWMIPYVSCMIVAVGLLFHFSQTLLRFLRRRDAVEVQSERGLRNMYSSFLSRFTGGGKEAEAAESAAAGSETGTAAADEQAPSRFEIEDRKLTLQETLATYFPALVVLLGAAYIGWIAVPPSVPEDGMAMHQFGKLPLVYEGRVKPFDTLARNTLRISSSYQTFKDDAGQRRPAVRWLLDMLARPERGEEHKVYKITNNRILETLELPRRRKHLYSRAEVLQHAEELEKQAKLAHQVEDLNKSAYQKKVVELENMLRQVNVLIDAFARPEIALETAPEDLLHAHLGLKFLRLRQPPLAVPPVESDEQWEAYTVVATRERIRELARELEAGDTGEFAAALLERWPQDVATRAVGEARSFIQQKVEESDGASTFKQAAQTMADTWPVELFRDIAAQLAETPQQSDREIAARLSRETTEGLHAQAVRRFIDRLTSRQFEELRQKVAGAVREREQAGAPDDFNSYMSLILRVLLDDLMGDAALEEATNPAYEHLRAILTAYENGDTEAFREHTEAYRNWIAEHTPQDVDLDKVRFESYFNHLAPFFYSAVLYLMAFVLAAAAWLGWARPLNRASFWLIVVALGLHTFALVSRMYISGRPPVTNLYSSAVFIGWGCVVLGLIFEMVYRLGIGNVVAAVSGFGALMIAHLLTTMVPSHKGDTFKVLQAVLDTQFWLATHVVCITLGYATTFVAGILGIKYILRGVLTPTLSDEIGKSLARMIYGTLCFAIFFSFVGTVLGGLWADDSWGRFWGWDPKENGALIIVLWNALVLHARWDGMVRDRGMAVLAVAGNICTAWSWFGVNELGVGLHSYGFTEGVLLALGIFVASQLAIIGLGLLPKTMWWSFAGQEAPAPTPRGRRKKSGKKRSS